MDIKLKKDILKEIEPTKNEDKNFKKIVDDFLSLLEDSARKLNLKVDFLVGGSFGKGTYLKGTFDVDIFTRFDLKYEDSKLSSYTKEILEKARIDFKKQKGSRDYYSGFYGKDNKIYYELVPNYNIYDIKDAKNTTDFSPLHLLFLKNQIKKDPNLSDEIRLTKQYFKSKKLYGAESYIGGFSGHTIDLLIVYFKTLENLLENAKNWGSEEIIDINNFYKNNKDIKLNINESKQSNLIIIDPIDPKRNASKALDKEKYAQFLLICKNQNKLTKEDFIIKKESFSQLINKAKKFEDESKTTLIIYEVKFSTKDSSDDIVGTKMLKLYEKIENYISSYDFNIFSKAFHIDISKNSSIFIYFIKHKEIPSLKLIHGPDIFLKEAVENFSKDKENIFTLNSKVCYYQKRTVTKIDQISSFNVDKAKEIFKKDLSCMTSIKLIDK